MLRKYFKINRNWIYKFKYIVISSTLQYSNSETYLTRKCTFNDIDIYFNVNNIDSYKIVFVYIVIFRVDLKHQMTQIYN